MNVVTREFLEVGHQWQPADLFEQQQVAYLAGAEMGEAMGLLLHLPGSSSNDQVVHAANTILERTAAKSQRAERTILQLFHRAASPHSTLAIAVERRAEQVAPAYFAASALTRT